MKKMLLVIITILNACSPVYQTSYSYTPPGDLASNTCANQCQLTQLQCEQNILRNLQSCQRRADLNYNLCRSRRFYPYNRINRIGINGIGCFSNRFCNRRTCNGPNIALCTERYNSCYLNCGGTIITTTECVEHCGSSDQPLTQVRKGVQFEEVDINDDANLSTPQ